MAEQPRVPKGQPTGGRWSKPGGGGTRGATSTRGDWSGAGGNPSALSNKEREERLEGPVAASEILPGGISETYKVTLEDGTVGNFKVDAGKNMARGAETEVLAWEVAKIVGMEDMVPAATIREMDDPKLRGSYAEWMEGTPAKRVRPNKMFGNSEEDLQRAAMFDHILGNGDRHDGNWVINDEGKIGLIDHNIMLGTPQPYSQFLSQVNAELKDKPVAPYVKPYIDNLDKIIATVEKSGVSDSEGLKIKWLKQRVRRAKEANTWEDITGEEGDLEFFESREDIGTDELMAELGDAWKDA